MAETIPTTENEGSKAEPTSCESDVQTRLLQAEQQRDEMLRTLADYENARKRAARDLDMERKFAHLKFATDLLPALDNLDRALEAAKQAGEKGALIQGVQATRMFLMDALKRHGISIIDSMGKPFDPNLHQAVQMVPSADAAPNTVVQILQQGYTIHDRILRPASVVIVSPS